jgi:hypothetical protein
MGRAVGILCRCALCDSYFVLELGQVDMATYRGKKGKAALMDYFEKLQARYDTNAAAEAAAGSAGAASEDSGAAPASDRQFRDGRASTANGHEFMSCPTCVEATHGMRYAEWVSRGGVFAASGRHTLEPEPEPEAAGASAGSGGGDDVALSLVEYVRFDEEEPPPLFLDEQGTPGKKPKWTLCQGVGPPALEVDSSRSGRVFKPSLRPFGISRPIYQPLDPACTTTPSEHREVCAAVFDAVSFHGVNPAELLAAAPLFAEWTVAGSPVRATVEAAAEHAAERERAATALKTAGMVRARNSSGAARLASERRKQTSFCRCRCRCHCCCRSCAPPLSTLRLNLCTVICAAFLLGWVRWRAWQAGRTSSSGAWR